MQKVLAYAALPPRSRAARNVAWVYAAILTIMAIGQLFAFEKFLPLLENYWLPGGHGTATLVGCLVAFMEVFSLPFLLRMKLSIGFRWVSMAFGLIVPVVWLVLGLVVVVSHSVLHESGMFGTKLNIPAGGVQIVLSLVLLAIALYSAHGLWPLRKK